MSHEIHANYKQNFILPPELENWVPLTHPARFIRAFVDEQNLAALGFKQRKGNVGAPNYSANLLVKIFLYGYFHKIRPLRALEHACYNDMGMIWLTGNKHPDHNTLNRFFRNNRKAFGKLFKKSILKGIEMNLVELALVAVDGTRILSNVKRSKLISRNEIKELLQKIDSDTIEEILKDIEDQSDNDLAQNYALPDELSDPDKLREAIRNQNLLDAAGVNYIHPTDPDARMMKTSEGIKPGFNAQVMVDSKAGLIVANGVTQDASDTHQLAKMLENVIAMTDSKPVEIVGDSGYCSGVEIAKVEEMGVECIVNIKRTPSFDSRLLEGFVYDETTDTYTCEHGGVLSHKGFRQHKYSRQKLYYCESYKNCPLRNDCSPNRRKCLSVGTNRDAVDRQIEKQKLPENKEKLSRRMGIVENVFAYAKTVMKFRRWESRGLENAQAQWVLLCTAMNLNKIYRYSLN